MRENLNKNLYLIIRSAVVLLTTSITFADSPQLSVFSGQSVNGWEEKEFSSSTSYQISSIEGRQAILAKSQNSASALFKKVHVDIREYPYLNWNWRIENRLDTEDEKAKAGDDYAVRIYVVVDGKILFWRTRAVSYVWANGVSKGEIWPNAYAGNNVLMMALRDRRDKLSKWYFEKRNVYEDLKLLFGSEFQFIDAIAIMSDSDDSHGQIVAYYGDIYFSKN